MDFETKSSLSTETNQVTKMMQKILSLKYVNYDYGK